MAKKATSKPKANAAVETRGRLKARVNGSPGCFAMPARRFTIGCGVSTVGTGDDAQMTLGHKGMQNRADRHGDHRRLVALRFLHQGSIDQLHDLAGFGLPLPIGVGGRTRWRIGEHAIQRNIAEITNPVGDRSVDGSVSNHERRSTPWIPPTKPHRATAVIRLDRRPFDTPNSMPAGELVA